MSDRAANESALGDYEGKPATPENIGGALMHIFDEGTRNEQVETSPAFTPGPWHWLMDANDGRTVIYAGSIGDGEGIAAVEKHVNARLIVESPAMYEALRAIVEEIEVYMRQVGATR